MSTERIDVEALRGHTPGPWKVLQLTREVAVEAPCGRVIYCVSRECDAQVEADGCLIAAAPALLAEVIERRARDAAVAELVAASQSSAETLKRAGESSIDHYERIAAAFKRDTGMLAPGKDQPAATGGPDFRERMDAYEAWLDCKRDRFLAALAAVQGAQP